MYIVAELKTDNGTPITVLTVAPKDFKTGSKGYYGNAKVEFAGKKYQIQLQIVEIGSKIKTETG
jgi:hypothetical protein